MKCSKCQSRDVVGMIITDFFTTQFNSGGAVLPTKIEFRCKKHLKSKTKEFQEQDKWEWDIPFFKTKEQSK